MRESLDYDLGRTWELLRPYAHRIEPELAIDERLRSWSDSVQSLADLFAGHIGPDPTGVRFTVPTDYARFMATVGGDWWWGDEEKSQTLFSAASVNTETAWDFELFVTDRHTKPSDFDEPPDEGVWLTIGGIPGWKRTTLLCCDRQHDDYGCVVEHHDGHPWLNGARSYDVMNRTFSGWMAEQADAERRRSVDPAPK